MIGQDAEFTTSFPRGLCVMSRNTATGPSAAGALMILRTPDAAEENCNHPP